MSGRDRLSPLVVVEAILCFGPILAWWLWGAWALSRALFHSGTVPASAVTKIALGGLGLLGVALLVSAASRGVHRAGAWVVLVACLACGMTALLIAEPLPILQRPSDPADVVFLLLPGAATLHLLLVAVLRSRASRAPRSG